MRTFYLGAPEPTWLRRTEFEGVPLFVSHRRLERVRTHAPAVTDWALDSGGFTELSQFHEWQTTPAAYVAAVRTYADEIGRLQWAAPQDWMCEDVMISKTGKSIAEHQRLTTESLIELRTLDASLPFVPVLQGQTIDDYLHHADAYVRAGFDLASETVVGVGSVCRRQSGIEAARIFTGLRDRFALDNLHGFGVKQTGLQRYGDYLATSDSMAWSFAARMIANKRDGEPIPPCTHRSCSYCPRFAIEWRENLLANLDGEPTLFDLLTIEDVA